MRARSLLLPCSVLLAAALVLAGCGDDPAKVLAAAPAKTQAAGSSKMAIDISVSAPAGGQQVEFNGQGAFDYAGRKGSLSVQLPAGPGGAANTLDVVVIGDVVYQRLPAASGLKLPKGKPWVRLDTKQLGTTGAAQSQASDPRAALRFLAGVSGKIDTVGKEKLRDAGTTHYRTTLDLTKAAKAASGDSGAIDALIKQIGTSSVPADIWIDGDGRLRRLHYGVDVKAAQATPQATKIDVDLELFEFGTAVTVAPPPADQVADAGSMLGGTGG